MALNLDPVLDALMIRLGPLFSQVSVSEDHNIALSFAQQAPPGQKWPGGSIWKNHPGITHRALRIILETSRSIEEAAERIRLYIFDNVDTTAPPMPKPATEQVIPEGYRTQILEEAKQQARIEFQKLLGKARQKLEAPDEDKLAEAAVERVEDPPTPRKEKEGLQAKPKRKTWQELRDDKQRDIESWRERCKLMGYHEPKLTKQGFIDTRWLRHAITRWEEYTSTHQS